MKKNKRYKEIKIMNYKYNFIVNAFDYEYFNRITEDTNNFVNKLFIVFVVTNNFIN